MYKILFIFFMVILFTLLYQILSIIFNVESKSNKKAFYNSRVYKKAKKNPKYIFTKYIHLSNLKKSEIKSSLYSLNIDITPEEYISENIFTSLMLLPIIIILLLLKNTFFAVLISIFIPLVFINSQNRINKMLSKRRRFIEEEAPSLIRYFMVSLKNTSDIRQIFENYSEIADYLKRDIELTVTDMNSMRNREDNVIRSLELLDDRLNTPIMNDFITGLINVTLGKNQESYFALLERELKELTMYNLNLKSNKIEKQVKRYFWILVIFFMLITVTEFMIFLKASISF